VDDRRACGRERLRLAEMIFNLNRQTDGWATIGVY
jgi:hypothetical protein